MRERVQQVSAEEFLQYYLQNAQHLMWFLGAGTSRSAGLPTATDIIWDLKHRYYCLYENQDLQSHDINNKAIKQKIQTYMDSKGHPASGSPEEYSFYFKLTFGEDYAAQQNYINEALSNDQVSLNVGQRALAALLEMGKAKIVFTTNFDDVMETAYANVSGKSLSTSHLEGSYAALNALNSERFPLYAKVHGDFRYQSIKNLAADLLDNDYEIQKCFLAASARYGLVVSGYSGRDKNVIVMLRKAMDQNNAFPHGFFWTVPRLSEITESVRELLEDARRKGVQANFVETGTFDEMLSRIWRQVQRKPQSLADKVRAAQVESVSIPLPALGNRYPILRTNALPVIEPPSKCGAVDLRHPLTFNELKKKIISESPNVILTTYKERILFWGSEEEVAKVLTKEQINSICPFVFEDVVQDISVSTFMRSFFEKAVAKALCWGKPLLLRRHKNKTHYAVVHYDRAKDKVFAELRSILKTDTIAGQVPGIQDLTWAEALSIQLEVRNGKLWILLRPDIWIKPFGRKTGSS